MILGSLRGRIAIAAAAATAVVILLGGFLVTFFLASAERDGLDERLGEQSQIAQTTLREALLNGEDLDSLTFETRRPDVGTAIRVFRGGTQILAVGETDATLAQPTTTGFRTQRVGVQSWRVYVTSVDAAGENLLIETAVPTTVTESLIGEVRNRVFLVAAACALMSGVLGWAFGGVATRPLAQLREAAERISRSRDLSVRAPVDLGPAEVDGVARSLNVMLSRLEEASASTESALASSRAFAGNAAHEMRTPLTSMQANLDVLNRNPDLPQTQRDQIVTSVISEQDRLTRLLDALSTLARGDVISSAQLEQIDFADLVGVAVESANRRNPNLELTYQVPAEITELYAWSDGLRVLVDNLLTNAVRHGGKQISVKLDSDDHGLVLLVEDDGPGIPIDEREQVFSRFYRGRGVTSPGSGLGLALVAQQARIHGGTVSVSDSYLGGARFAVHLRGVGSGRS